MKVLNYFLFCCVIVITSCGDTEHKVPTDNDQNTNDSDQVCIEEKTKCTDNSVHKCKDGIWTLWEDCSFFNKECSVKDGEAQCFDDISDDENTSNTGDIENDEDQIDLCKNVICTALDQCHNIGICESDTGKCSNPVRTGSCSDDNNYTINDKCVDGNCIGETVSCINSTDCNNDDVCDGDEICEGSTCQAGMYLDCNDKNSLTIDSCNPTTGCENEEVECSEKTDCNEGKFWETPLCDAEHECSYDIECPGNSFSLTVPKNTLQCNGKDKNWETNFVKVYPEAGELKNPSGTCHIICYDMNLNPITTLCNWKDTSGYYNCKSPYYDEGFQAGCSFWYNEEYCIEE